MTYAELKQAVLDDSHRPDLSDHVARFVREAEGHIRRELRAYIVSTPQQVQRDKKRGVIVK